jgi:uncharacterized membrane protein (UPF0127 family)
MRIFAAALGVVILATSCSSSGSPTSERGDPPELNRGTALIETDGASALFYVSVAETAEQRARAFETTTSLEDDEGMAFLYFEPTSDPFVMEGSLALSVAFFDLDGEILEIVDAEPCGASSESCPTYDPGVAYTGALGVGRGVFERVDVHEGASVQIVPGSE